MIGGTRSRTRDHSVIILKPTALATRPSTRFIMSNLSLPDGTFAAVPDFRHGAGVVGPGLRGLHDQLELLRLQVGNKLGVAEALVVAHVGVERCKTTGYSYFPVWHQLRRN